MTRAVVDGTYAQAGRVDLGPNRHLHTCQRHGDAFPSSPARASTWAAGPLRLSLRFEPREFAAAELDAARVHGTCPAPDGRTPGRHGGGCRPRPRWASEARDPGWPNRPLPHFLRDSGILAPISELPARPDDLLELVVQAGERILEWYGVPGRVTVKEDRSPLTLADRQAHACLEDGLLRLAPDLPVVSEESPAEARWVEREWERYWLVDPLDGTKEFLKGTGEFTVNIALVERGRPVYGIVHAPALGRTYRGHRGGVSEKAGTDGRFRAVRTRRLDLEQAVLVGSRDHSGPALERLVRRTRPGVEFTSMGSSLKFCLIAEGEADLYLRDGPTMGWDTAAAQCVVESAGGGVFALDPPTLEVSLRYDAGALRNPHFCCVGDPTGSWRPLIRLASPQR